MFLSDKNDKDTPAILTKKGLIRAGMPTVNSEKVVKMKHDNAEVKDEAQRAEMAYNSKEW